ncbi:cellulosome anchor protein [Natrinema zhouii]|uniref:Cellulosome anchor protein n=1 Tax=Natrinema zhouii TaxID=1710539 RepID=A0A7D6GT86_9EURY|nr:cohesin domain-containing protein [Natrinema zhouii]QLK27902.1 cellulosome anchor protein [Natrinema zhouii]
MTGIARIVVGSGLAVLLALSVVGAAGTAVAIDQVAILSPEQRTVEAAPGETIEIDVTLQSQGGHGNEGISGVALIAQYHPDYLEVTDIERGPWLEGEETEIRTTERIAHERGTAFLEQRREPAAGGTTGTGTIATLTVRVADDAPAGTTAISFDETDVALTGDWPIAVVDESVTVAVDGGDQSLESFDHPDPDELDLESEERSENNSSDVDSGAADNGGDLPVPGFTIGVTLVAVALAVLRLIAARDHPPR